MNLLKIDEFDDKNGDGARMTIFVSGCPHKCLNCFNKISWGYKNGFECTSSVKEAIFSKFRENVDFLSGLSILGGEPLAPRNFKEVIVICKEFKTLFPNKNIWLWSGYTLEEIQHLPQNKALKYIDTLVDGRFVEELKDTELNFRGSSNQRILKNGIDF